MRIVFIAISIVITTVSIALADIIGLPWSTWGEVNYTPGVNVDKGVILQMYAEQGIDWLKLGDSNWILNTFTGLQLSASDHGAEFWNNVAKPTLGIKVKHSFETDLLGGSGDIALGLRGEYQGYFHDSSNNNWRGIAYIQWSGDGDWKKKR
jgi:hypothetical protein